jgi:Eukaryotic translation initiation factor 3 subunit 8 N-terminus
MSRFFRQAGDSDSDTESSEEELISSGDEDAGLPKPAAPAKPMSRFLRTAGDASDSDSDSSEEEESDESDDDDEARGPKKSKFLHTGSDDEESDEDVKRVVKSAKDKRLEEMETTSKAMDNAIKINDWITISSGVCIKKKICMACLSHVLSLIKKIPSRIQKNTINLFAWCNDNRTYQNPCLLCLSALYSISSLL